MKNLTWILSFCVMWEWKQLGGNEREMTEGILHSLVVLKKLFNTSPRLKGMWYPAVTEKVQEKE